MAKGRKFHQAPTQTVGMIETLQAHDSSFVKGAIWAKLALPTELNALNSNPNHAFSYLKVTIWPDDQGVKWVRLYVARGKEYRLLWDDLFPRDDKGNPIYTAFLWDDVLVGLENPVVEYVGQTDVRDGHLVEFVCLVKALRDIHREESLQAEELRRQDSVGGEVMADAFHKAEVAVIGDHVPTTKPAESESQAQVA